MAEPKEDQAVAVVEAAGTGLVAQGGFDIRTLDQAWRLAQAFIGGKMVPRGMNEPGGVVACWQAGAEMGVGPARSLAKISIINGVPCVEVELALGLTRKHGAYAPDGRPAVEWSMDGQVIKESIMDGLGKLDKWPDSLTCMASAVPNGGGCTVARQFSVADARRAHLWDAKDVWKSYPKRMLRARAMAFLMRDEFSEYFEGSITEEMRDVPRDVTPHGGAEDTPAPATPDADPLFDAAVQDAEIVEPQDPIDPDDVPESAPPPQAEDVLGPQDADISSSPLRPEQTDEPPPIDLQAELPEDGSMLPLPEANKKYRTMKRLVHLFAEAEHPMTFKTVSAWTKEQRIAAWEWIWDRKAFDHWMGVNPKSVRANTTCLPRPSFVPEYGEVEAQQPPPPGEPAPPPAAVDATPGGLIPKPEDLSPEVYCLRPIGITGAVCGMDPGHPGTCTPL